MEAQLATALDSRLEEFQKYASALDSSSKWSLWDNRRRKAKGRKGRKQHMAKKCRRGVEEQCGQEVVQEVELGFQVSVLDCDAFDKALFPQFMEELQQEYNRIQFETCDPLFS